MRDAGFHEFVTDGDIAMLAVKAQRVGLGMQTRFSMTMRPRQADEFPQQRAADPMAAPVRQHGHASDTTIRQQPPSADRAAVARHRHHVQARRIQSVPLFAFRDMLFKHEHRASDLGQQCTVTGPVRTPHLERR